MQMTAHKSLVTELWSLLTKQALVGSAARGRKKFFTLFYMTKGEYFTKITLYSSWQQNAFEKITNEATSLLNITFKQLTVLHEICFFFP